MRSANAAAVSASPERTMDAVDSRFKLADREATLLKVDLSDLALPKVNDLHVDGLKRSWLSRLFGKR